MTRWNPLASHRKIRQWQYWRNIFGYGFDSLPSSTDL